MRCTALEHGDIHYGLAEIRKPMFWRISIDSFQNTRLWKLQPWTSLKLGNRGAIGAVVHSRPGSSIISRNVLGILGVFHVVLDEAAHGSLSRLSPN